MVVKKYPCRDVHMTQRDQCWQWKIGELRAPRIDLMKYPKELNFASQIWGALNPPLFHHQLIHLGHMNIRMARWQKLLRYRVWHPRATYYTIRIFIRTYFVRSRGSNWSEIKKFIYMMTSLLLNKGLRLNSVSNLLIYKKECITVLSVTKCGLVPLPIIYLCVWVFLEALCLSCCFICLPKNLCDR